MWNCKPGPCVDATDGLDGEGARVPGHEGNAGAELVGRRLQSHPVDRRGAHHQHFSDSV